MKPKEYVESLLGTLLLAALVTTLVIPRKNPNQSADAVKGAFTVMSNAVSSIFGKEPQ